MSTNATSSAFTLTTTSVLLLCRASSASSCTAVICSASCSAGASSYIARLCRKFLSVTRSRIWVVYALLGSIFCCSHLHTVYNTCTHADIMITTLQNLFKPQKSTQNHPSGAVWTTSIWVKKWYSEPLHDRRRPGSGCLSIVRPYWYHLVVAQPPIHRAGALIRLQDGKSVTPNLLLVPVRTSK